MNILVVYSHHEPSSFTAAMKNVAASVLGRQGHSVVISDLYGQGFSPVAQKWDFVTTSGKHFNYMLEQKHAARLDLAFSPDILGEIEKLKAADLVLFVAPIWWFDLPAMLRGWFDRVLAMGVAWDNDKIYENGMLRGKQSMVVTSAGGSPEAYQSTGQHKADINQILHHINYTTLAYCGFNVHEPYVAFNTLIADQAGRERLLADLTFRLNNLTTSPQWLTYYT